jgi:hypothetical protein
MLREPCSKVGFAGFARALPLAAPLLLALALFPRPGYAECGCLWEGSFAEVQARADLIVAGTVVEIKGNAVDLQVEESLRGKTYLDQIRIWMATRDYCRPEAEAFPPGSRWIMALNRISEVPDDGFDPGTPNQSFGRVDDYYLSNCGGYWLNYSGEAVTGNLVNAPRWARDPDMTPVLLDLLRAYVRGEASREALQKASEEDPELTDLMLDTKAFLRGQDPES